MIMMEDGRQLLLIEKKNLLTAHGYNYVIKFYRWKEKKKIYLLGFSLLIQYQPGS